MKTNYDIIIVGSGFGAAPPALRLRRAGYTTLVLEKGPRIDPMKDFKQTQDHNYLLKYLKSMTDENLTMNYVEGLGGGSGFFEKIVLRAPKVVFDQTSNGYRLWPSNLTREKLDPYYSIGERMIHAHQMKVEHIPKTGLVFSMLMRDLGYSVDRCRYADSFCSGCGYCVFGCVHGGKESLLVNYLPQAEDRGTIIKTEREVTRIRPINQNKQIGGDTSISTIPHRYEVSVLNQKTGIQSVYTSKILILAGGTIGTAKLLLTSGGFLPALSDQVGKNVAINGSVQNCGILPDKYPDGDMFTGQSHPGIVSYEFFNSHGIMISAAKALPLQIFGTARLSTEQKNGFWGDTHVDLVKKIRKRMIILDAHGITPPSAELYLDKNREIKVNMKITKEIKAYYRNTKTIIDSIISDSGCQPVNLDYINREGMNFKNMHFHTAHQVGSCRMAEKKENGVTDPGGEVFGYPGMYITDGAAVPSSTGVNVSLTILANAERITHEIIAKYK